jgi:hypothetical protein
MSMADLVERAYGFDRSLRDRVVSSLVRDPATDCVGQKLVVDDERIRHKHVSDYVWPAPRAGAHAPASSRMKVRAWTSLKFSQGKASLPATWQVSS